MSFLQRHEEMPTPPRLTFRYVAALLAVAFLSLLAFLITERSLQRQSRFSEAIDQAGRQKILCRQLEDVVEGVEKASREDLIKVYAGRAAQVSSLIFRGQSRLVQLHASLWQNSTQGVQASQILTNVQPYFDSLTVGVQGLKVPAGNDEQIRRQNTAVAHKIFVGVAAYLESLDNLVYLYHAEIATEVAYLHKTQLLLVTCVLIVLLLEGLLIFRPATRTVYRILDRLRGAVKNLQQENEARQQAEQALKRSEQDYRGIFENAHDAILIFRPDDEVVLDANQRACELYGYHKEELVGMSLEKLSQDVALGKRRIQTVLSEKAPMNFETVQFRKNGQVMFLEVNATIVDYHGQTAILSINRDITERKAGEKLQSALYRISELATTTENMEEFYRGLHAVVGELMYAENFYVALCHRDSDVLTCPYFADQYEPAFKERRKAGGLTEFVISSQKPLLASRRKIQRMIKAGEVNLIGKPAVDWLGVPFRCGEEVLGALVVQSYRQKIRYKPKDKIILTFVAQHIGNALERKIYLEKLSREREWLRVTMRNVVDGMITLDAGNCILLMNRVAEKLTGWKAAAAAGRPFEEIARFTEFHKNIELSTTIVQTLGEKKIYNINRARLISDDPAGTRTVSLRAAPIIDKLQQVVGAVLAFRDITDELKREQELQKIEKLESVGVLAGGIAHDFNNILTAIIGNLSMARTEVAGSESGLSRLSAAERACYRAKELTQQLLTFSRGGDPIKTTASLEDIVHDAASFALHGSKIRCDYKIDPDLWPMEADEGQISQVVHNIVINAVQAMPNGGRIEIVCTNFSVEEGATTQSLPLAPGSYVKLSIRDEGPGIPEEYLQQIFDPYFTTKLGGNGLGLASCYSIVSKHNGFITANSVINEGSTFDVYLPASPGAPVAKKESVESEVKTGQGKVLVVDDEEPIREVMAFMLDYLGYQTVQARDGAEAISLYQKAIDSGEPFNAVIMDLTIPGGVGGKEAIADLQKIDPQIRAIVSSGYSNDPIMSNFRDYGFCACVLKPFNLQDISNVLHKVL